MFRPWLPGIVLPEVVNEIPLFSRQLPGRGDFGRTLTPVAPCALYAFFFPSLYFLNKQPINHDGDGQPKYPAADKYAQPSFTFDIRVILAYHSRPIQ